MYNVSVRTNVLCKNNRSVVYSCTYHVIWCPKYRRPVLVDGVDVRLKEILYQTAEELESEIIELEVMPDQVHLLCEADPQFGIHFRLGPRIGIPIRRLDKLSYLLYNM